MIVPSCSRPLHPAFLTPDVGASVLPHRPHRQVRAHPLRPPFVYYITPVVWHQQPHSCFSFVPAHILLCRKPERAPEPRPPGLDCRSRRAEAAVPLPRVETRLRGRELRGRPGADGGGLAGHAGKEVRKWSNKNGVILVVRGRGLNIRTSTKMAARIPKASFFFSFFPSMWTRGVNGYVYI